MAATRALHGQNPCYPTNCRDMSQDDISKLTSILSRTPPPDLPPSSAQYQSYCTITERQISRLPSHLLSASSRTANRINRLLSRPSGLCRLHDRLNADLIDSTFHCLQSEIEDKISVSLHEIRNLPAYAQTYFPIMAFLNDVQALWLDHEAYVARFGYEASDRFKYQANRCNACMLAELGSDKNALIALLAGEKMRMRERRTELPCSSFRISWITVWMSHFPDGQGAEMLRVAGAIGSQLKLLSRQVRRDAHVRRGEERQERRQERSDRAGAVASSSMDGSGNANRETASRRGPSESRSAQGSSNHSPSRNRYSDPFNAEIDIINLYLDTMDI